MEQDAELLSIAESSSSAVLEASSSAVPYHFMYKDYDLSVFRKLESEVMLRRSRLPQSGVQASEPRRGEDGALQHWRRGLVGAVQDWADGSLANVVALIVRLVNHFEVREDVVAKLIPGMCVTCDAEACVHWPKSHLHAPLCAHIISPLAHSPCPTQMRMPSPPVNARCSPFCFLRVPSGGEGAPGSTTQTVHYGQQD